MKLFLKLLVKEFWENFQAIPRPLELGGILEVIFVGILGKIREKVVAEELMNPFLRKLLRDDISRLESLAKFYMKAPEFCECMPEEIPARVFEKATG